MKYLLLLVLLVPLTSGIGLSSSPSSNGLPNLINVPTTTIINNNTISVNASVWWAGMNGIQSPWLQKTSTNLDFNTTQFFNFLANNQTSLYNNISLIIPWNVSGTNLFPANLNNKVGIGTSNPSQALTIVNGRMAIIPTTTTNQAIIEFTNLGGSSYLGMDSSTGGGLGSNTPYTYTLYAGGSIPIAFVMAGTEAMRITNGGLIGIGTNNPTPEKLVVNDEGTLTTYKRLVRFRAAGGDNLGFGMSTTTNYITTAGNSLAFATSLGTDGSAIPSNVVMTMLNGGNVGIGTTTPSRTLDVRGIGNFSGTVYINNGTDLATVYVPYSGATGNVNLGNNNLSAYGLNISKYLSGLGSENFTATIGSFALGLITGTSPNSVQTIKSTASTGSFAWGSVTTSNAANSSNNILSSGQGSIAMGAVVTEGGANISSNITSTSTGSVAMGSTSAGVFGANNNNALLSASGAGSFALGRVSASTDGRNATLSATGLGSFITGYSQDSKITANGQGSFTAGLAGRVNSNITNDGLGGFIHGYIGAATNTLNNGIYSNGAGSFINAYIPLGSVNNSLINTGAANFINGILAGNNQYIMSSGSSNTIIGSSNITIGGNNNIALGQNINITGSNSFMFGANESLQTITGNNIFGISSANLVISDNNFTGAYPLTVNKGVSNISAYFQNQISATGYLTRTDIYNENILADILNNQAQDNLGDGFGSVLVGNQAVLDEQTIDTNKKKVKAIDNIHDFSYYLDANTNEINHSAFGYSYVKYSILEQNGTIEGLENSTQQDEDGIIRNVSRRILIPTYKLETREAVDLTKEIALLKQALYESNQRINNICNNNPSLVGCD